MNRYSKISDNSAATKATHSFKYITLYPGIDMIILYPGIDMIILYPGIDMTIGLNLLNYNEFDINAHLNTHLISM